MLRDADRPAPIVAVTRAAGSNGALADLLQARGVSVCEVPLIKFAPPGDVNAWRAWLTELFAGARRPGDRVTSPWVAVTSPQGARALTAGVQQLGWNSAEAWPPMRIAAVGMGTQAALQQAGLPVSFVPSRALAEALAAELPAESGDQVWHVTSQRSERTLEVGLSERGVTCTPVEAYRTHDALLTPEQVQMLRQANAVVLASGSAVRALARQVGVGAAVVVMGEPSARVARAEGFTWVVVAERPGLHEVADAVARFFRTENVALSSRPTF